MFKLFVRFSFFICGAVLVLSLSLLGISWFFDANPQQISENLVETLRANDLLLFLIRLLLVSTYVFVILPIRVKRFLLQDGQDVGDEEVDKLTAPQRNLILTLYMVCELILIVVG